MQLLHNHYVLHCRAFLHKTLRDLKNFYHTALYILPYLFWLFLIWRGFDITTLALKKLPFKITYLKVYSMGQITRMVNLKKIWVSPICSLAICFLNRIKIRLTHMFLLMALMVSPDLDGSIAPWMLQLSTFLFHFQRSRTSSIIPLPSVHGCTLLRLTLLRTFHMWLHILTNLPAVIHFY